MYCPEVQYGKYILRTSLLHKPVVAISISGEDFSQMPHPIAKYIQGRMRVLVYVVYASCTCLLAQVDLARFVRFSRQHQLLSGDSMVH